eukprot:7123149-Pyramimonas_sp.AAC.2
MSRTYQVSKQSGKEGTKSMRLLRELRSFGNLWVKTAQRKGRNVPDHGYGYLLRRSRAGATQTTACLSWRTRRHRISTVDAKHDMQNAFASVRHPQLDGAVRRLYRASEAKILVQRHQRHRRACFKSGAEGEVITMKNEGGNYMGDSNAATLFQEAFAVPAGHWQQLHHEKYPNELVACYALSDELVDLSLRAFADNVNKTHRAVDPAHTRQTIMYSDKQLDTALRGIGVVQSQGKKAAAPHYVGPGSHAYNRRVSYGLMNGDIPGTILEEATFLGATFTSSGIFGPNFAARCAAARRGWYFMEKFWATSSSGRSRRLRFGAW